MPLEFSGRIDRWNGLLLLCRDEHEQRRHWNQSGDSHQRHCPGKGQHSGERVGAGDHGQPHGHYHQRWNLGDAERFGTVADGGMVTYAWYSNTKRSTDGATSLSVATAAYSPDVSAAGTTYYYCFVTNTNRFEGLFMFGE